jgi:hypothetical protein
MECATLPVALPTLEDTQVIDKLERPRITGPPRQRRPRSCGGGRQTERAEGHYLKLSNGEIIELRANFQNETCGNVSSLRRLCAGYQLVAPQYAHSIWQNEPKMA